MRRAAGIAAVALLAAACGAAGPVPVDEAATDEPASELPAQPTRRSTPVPVATPVRAATSVPTAEPVPTATPEPTGTPVAAPTSTPEPEWSLVIGQIDDEVRARIEPTSWRPGCPVDLADLRLLTFPHVTFDGQVAIGELIVAATVADQVGEVFRLLFEAGYPIQRIELVDTYGGDDLISMQANNTSAFNCREVAGRPGVWSNHALGLAVDLNPLMNPLVSGSLVDPPEGADYLDRADARLGMILPGDAAVEAFAAIGWRWGGDWTGLKDYQHFSHNGR